jgi:hypothetical protein
MTTTLLPISSIHWLYVAELGCVNEGRLLTDKFAANNLTDVPERKRRRAARRDCLPERAYTRAIDCCSGVHLQ